MRTITTIIILLFSLQAFCNNNDSLNISQLRNEIVVVKNELNSKIESQKSILDTSFSAVSLQISSSANLITVFSIIMTVIAIASGIYITYLEKKVVTILKANQQIKNDVIELNELINNDIKSLYLKFKNEETKDIINRLVSVPEDIQNVASLLLTREISESEYSKIKKACMEYAGNDPIRDLSSYHITLLQHFPIQSINDNDLKEYFDIHLVNILNLAFFKIDIIKFVKSIIEEYLNSKVSVVSLNRVISALNNTKYATNEQIGDLIFSILKNKNRQFDFYSKLDGDIIGIKQQCADLLVEKYKNDNNRQEEQIILKSITGN